MRLRTGGASFFLEWDVRPVRCRESHDRGQKHRPPTNPKCNAQRDNREAEIHRIARETVGSRSDELAICRRGRIDLSPLASKQPRRSYGQSATEDDQQNPQRCQRQAGNPRPSRNVADRRRDAQIEQRPNRRRQSEHRRPALNRRPTVAKNHRPLSRPDIAGAGTIQLNAMRQARVRSAAPRGAAESRADIQGDQTPIQRAVVLAHLWACAGLARATATSSSGYLEWLDELGGNRASRVLSMMRLSRTARSSTIALRPQATFGPKLSSPRRSATLAPARLHLCFALLSG